jgi:hypothetical protein
MIVIEDALALGNRRWKPLPNNSMQWTALWAVADAER